MELVHNQVLAVMVLHHPYQVQVLLTQVVVVLEVLFKVQLLVLVAQVVVEQELTQEQQLQEQPILVVAVEHQQTQVLLYQAQVVQA
jgi:hypothetical protein